MSLTLPATLHGRYAQVQRRCDAIVRKLPDATAWEALDEHGSGLDVESSPGLLVIDGPSPLLGGDPHFHCYVPLQRIAVATQKGRIDAGLHDAIFERALASTWGVLSLLAPVNVMWVFRPERHPLLLSAVLDRWDQLDGLGARYTVGSASPNRLWELPSNLKYVLSNLGASTEQLQAPLPSDGLASFAALL